MADQTTKIQHLENKVLDMETDIYNVVSTLKKAATSVGIDFKAMQNSESMDLMAQAPMIIQNVMMNPPSGEILSELNAVLSSLKKYEYLFPEKS